MNKRKDQVISIVIVSVDAEEKELILGWQEPCISSAIRFLIGTR